MKVLLVRTQPRNLFARLNIVRFEPLELEYLAAVVKELNHDCRIYDGFIERADFNHCLLDYRPDVVAITGYTIHVNRMKEYAAAVKKHTPHARVIVGGVHAELNWQDFYSLHIDVVIHANPVQAFKTLLLNMTRGQSLVGLKNICLQVNGSWLKTEAEDLVPDELPLPDRSHLKAYRSKFRYFGKEPCALVKTAWGCRHKCTFCYCARLNGGKYSTRSLDKVIEEIKGLEQEKIFIIDDNFLVSPSRVTEFCWLIEKENIRKNFSVYGRADFICAHESLLPRLKKAGVQEIIVGLESMDDSTLQSYQKQVTSQLNHRTIQLLRKHRIDSCALFIVDHHYGKENFRRLAGAIKNLQPDLCMFSIFTPLKGLPEYEAYKDQLIVPEDHCEAMDFIHLTLKPTKLSIPRFYYEFYKLYFLLMTDGKRLKAHLTPLLRTLANLIKELFLEGFAKVFRTRQRPF